MSQYREYIKGFIPYALAAFLIGIIGGFSAVLGPSFIQDIGISYNNTTWTTLAQAISTAACAPILGKIGDAIGRKVTLILGIAVFTFGNILSALATSLIFMIFSRFVVGIGTAAMAPAVISYIITQFPPQQVAKGFSVYMLISSASVVLGPSLGSLIISAYGWRTMQWICVVICSVTFAVCYITMGKQKPARRPIQNFDVSGAILIFAFFSMMLFIPSFGQNFGWTSTVFLLTLIAALLSLIALFVTERKALNPILSGNFMKRRAFILSVIALFLTQGLMQANMTNIIVFVNYTRSNSTTISGYAISVMYLAMSLGALILGPLSDRKEPKYVLIGSFALTGIGCAIPLIFSETTSILLLMLFLGVIGFGLGGNGTIFMKVVLSGLPAQESGTCTGTYGLFRDLSAPFGVAVLVPLFTNRITGLLESGEDVATAAVRSMHFLAMAEIFCVVIGSIFVSFLPRIQKKEKYDEIKK